MNSKIFTDWLQYLNRRMKLHKRKILLHMGNVSSHASADLPLSNVPVKFFPASTTSCLQLLDAGIIKMFKVHFRKHLLSHVLALIDRCNSATELSKRRSMYCMPSIGPSKAGGLFQLRQQRSASIAVGSNGQKNRTESHTVRQARWMNSNPQWI